MNPCRVSYARVFMAALLIAAAAALNPGSALAAKVSTTSFRLFPNRKFKPCLTDAGHTAKVNVQVKRGKSNDTMTLTLSGFKPNLDFDLFTVQNSPQTTDGSANPDFNNNFGLAWYQSDIQVGAHGTASVRIKTILLDQIFGFDSGAGLSPTNTFHVGFWFNRPEDATACGFTGTTPFNGEHNAGPLAFVSRPQPTTNLGPLCTDPNTSTFPATCNP